jgi:hypothetical protein
MQEAVEAQRRRANLNPLHQLPKELGLAMKGAERKLHRSRKCDLEGNECDGQEDFLG